MMNHNASFYFFVHLGPCAQLSLRECVLLQPKPLTLLGRGTGLQRMVMAFPSRSSSLCYEESLVLPWRSGPRGETYSMREASYSPSIPTCRNTLLRFVPDDDQRFVASTMELSEPQRRPSPAYRSCPRLSWSK